MNNNRRKAIREVIDNINGQLEILQGLQEEEQEFFDNMPENLQGSERGEAAEMCADAIQDVISEVETQMETLNESLDQ